MDGLNRSYKHLKRMGHSVLRLDMADLSQYADQVCVSNIGSLWLQEQIMLTDFDMEDLDKMNATSFGNLAYVALHHSNQSVRAKAVALIEKAKSLVL